MSSLTIKETTQTDFSFSGSILVVMGRRRLGKGQSPLPRFSSLANHAFPWLNLPCLPCSQPQPFHKNAALRSGAEAQEVKSPQQGSPEARLLHGKAFTWSDSDDTEPPFDSRQGKESCQGREQLRQRRVCYISITSSSTVLSRDCTYFSCTASVEVKWKSAPTAADIRASRLLCSWSPKE